MIDDLLDTNGVNQPLPTPDTPIPSTLPSLEEAIENELNAVADKLRQGLIDMGGGSTVNNFRLRP